MRRTKWQLSFFFCIAALFILIVNAQQETEKSSVKSIKTIATTTTTTTTTKRKHTKSRKHYTTTINNCSLASIQNRSTSSSSTTSTRLPHIQTFYVCKKQLVTGNVNNHRITTTKGRRPSSITTTKKSSPKKTTTTTKNITKKTTTKKTTKKTTTKKTTTKKTIKKTTTKKTTTTTTKITIDDSATSGFGALALAPPTATKTVETPLPTSYYSDDSNNDNGDNNNEEEEEEEQGGYTEIDLSATSTEDEEESQPTPAAAAVAAPVAPASEPKDINNQVNAQTVDSAEAENTTPQSKIIGVSVGAVVGCIAAAGLAGMFIYKRRERTSHDQDVEDMNQTSEVNTRWRTQSFMAVVAGAVAKLPKRSNSTSSNSGASGGVLGSIRRAASNASRSLSVRSKESARSSYGIAVSGPIPPITRIDGDRAQYYGDPESPTAGHHHTHAY